MIEQILIQNFKGLEKVEVSLGRVTIFIGPNGSGKSSVLQALALLKQSLGQTGLVMNGPEVQLGTWQDIIHGGSAHAEREMVIGVTGPLLRYPGERFAQTLAFRNGSAFRARAAAGALGKVFEGEWSATGDRQDREMRFGAKSRLVYRVQGTIGQPFSYAGGSAADEDRREWEVAARDFSALIGSLNSAIANEFESLSFVGPFRGIAKPAYPLAEGTFGDFVSVFGDWEPSARLLSTMGYRRELAREVAAMIKDLFGHEVEFALVPPRQTSLRSVFADFSTNIVNDGTALNQLLSLLSQFAVLPKGGTLAIEEPEIHLHPRLQRSLIDLLVGKALKEGKRLLLTTHSEHILLSVVAKVLKGDIKPEEFSLFQFSLRDGKAEAKRTQLTSDGTLSPPLQDFFETNMNELLELLRAVAGEQE